MLNILLGVIMQEIVMMDVVDALSGRDVDKYKRHRTY